MCDLHSQSTASCRRGARLRVEDKDRGTWLVASARQRFPVQERTRGQRQAWCACRLHPNSTRGVTVPTAQARNLRPRTQETAHSHRLMNQGTEANRGRDLDKLRRAPMVGCEFQAGGQGQGQLTALAKRGRCGGAVGPRAGSEGTRRPRCGTWSSGPETDAHPGRGPGTLACAGKHGGMRRELTTCGKGAVSRGRDWLRHDAVWWAARHQSRPWAES